MKKGKYMNQLIEIFLVKNRNEHRSAIMSIDVPYYQHYDHRHYRHHVSKHSIKQQIEENASHSFLESAYKDQFSFDLTYHCRDKKYCIVKCIKCIRLSHKCRVCLRLKTLRLIRHLEDRQTYLHRL